MSGDMLNLTVAFGGLFVVLILGAMVACYVDKVNEEDKKRLAASNDKQ